MPTVVMDGVFKVTRRAFGGAAGAPSSLLSGQVAYNETDDTVYIGFGDDGSGNATSIRAFAGAGTFATKAYVIDAMSDAGAGDMLKSEYDSDDNGKVDAADTADHVPWSGVDGKPGNATSSVDGFMSSTDKGKLDGIASNANNYSHPSGDGNLHVPATGTGNNGKFLKAGATAGSGAWDNVTKADVGLGNADNTSDANKPISDATQSALDDKAPLASPTFTGTPSAPTASAGNSSTLLATTAFVANAIAALIDGAPGALDTLKELADELGDQDDALSALVTTVAGKLAKSANLSDLTDVAAARTNLELGSMAQQSSSNVSISGGTISNVVFDGGTF